MRNQKTLLVLVAVALVLGSMGVAKAGKAFKDATSGRQSATVEAIDAAQGRN